MFHGTNGPGNECSRERTIQGMNVPRNEWSRERKFHHGNEYSRERIVLGTNIPDTQCYVFGTDNEEVQSEMKKVLRGDANTARWL